MDFELNCNRKRVLLTIFIFKILSLLFLVSYLAWTTRTKFFPLHSSVSFLFLEKKNFKWKSNIPHRYNLHGNSNLFFGEDKKKIHKINQFQYEKKNERKMCYTLYNKEVYVQ